MIKGPEDVTNDRAWFWFTVKYCAYVSACCIGIAACAYSIFKMF